MARVMTSPDLHERMAAMRALRVPGKPQSAKSLLRRRKARYEWLRRLDDSGSRDICLICFYSLQSGCPVINYRAGYPKAYGPHDCALAESEANAHRKREREKHARRRARHARVISGTGDSGERLELAALVRGLRAND